jgi:hypothetical protein
MRYALFAALTVSAACGKEGDSAAASCGEASTEGQIEGVVNGADWSTGATWAWSGSSLDITSDSAAGWRLSIVAQSTSGGGGVQDAVNDAAFPIDVILVDGTQGGWALMYPDIGSSFSTSQSDGGGMTVAGLDGETLWGCFSFVASDGVGAVEVDAAQFRLPSR